MGVFVILSYAVLLSIITYQSINNRRLENENEALKKLLDIPNALKSIKNEVNEIRSSLEE